MKTASPGARTHAAPAPPAGHPMVSRTMIYARTRQMAVRAGRDPLQIRQHDYELARIEMTGETDMARQEAVLDAFSSLPEGRTDLCLAALWENKGSGLAGCAA